MGFVRVMADEDLWEAEVVGRRIGDQKVLLVRLDGDVRAYEDRCAHKGVALSEGAFAGGVLTCFAHGWTYDLRRGCGVNPPGTPLRAFAVKIEGGAVWVDLPAPERGRP